MGRACLLACLLAAAAPARAADDADVWAAIEALRPTAAAIVVDGDGSDWGVIPAFSDPAGDAGGDATRDIVSARIAPTDDALAVLIRTAGSAAPSGYPFWIQLDFTGLAFADVELALDPFGSDGLSWFPEEGCTSPPCSADFEASELAIAGDTVEIRVPYAALDAALPASLQGKLSGAGARSWVRVWTHAIAYLPGYTEVDHGPAVGSFRLVAIPYALDPPLPSGGEPFTALPFPLDGLWYVGQGAMTLGSHAGIWAYDLHQTDNALHPEDPVGSQDLDDHFAFGAPIFAPEAGVVFSAVDGNADHPAYDDSPPPPHNFLFLEIPGDLGLLFTHAKQGTVAFAQDDPVPAGAVVARVGHSGATGWPHLHYHAEEIDDGFATHPLGITDVEIGLNPTPDDPWRRHLASWGIREGFFVLPEPPEGAALVAALTVLLALAIKRGSTTRRRRRI